MAAGRFVLDGTGKHIEIICELSSFAGLLQPIIVCIYIYGDILYVYIYIYIEGPWP